MRDALGKFVTAVSEEREYDRREKLPMRLLVSEAVAEHQHQLSSAAAGGWFGKQYSGVKHEHLGNLSTKCVVQGWWSIPYFMYGNTILM